MIISVVNHTNGAYTDEVVQHAIRAVNTQIALDFEPYWSMGAQLRLEGKTGAKPDPRKTEVRGDAVLYLWDKVQAGDALGFHDKTNHGVPYGFVFTELAERLSEDWRTTLSHEALELVADPEANLLVTGPNPRDADRVAYYWYEMCDPVQTESYMIGDVPVCNFVLPLYFTSGDEKDGRNDFLGRSYDGRMLTSFGVNPGGYLGYYDPDTEKAGMLTRPGDRLAQERLAIKAKALEERRASRSHRRGSPPPRLSKDGR
jgi:hypothetical protein